MGRKIIKKPSPSRRACWHRSGDSRHGRNRGGPLVPSQRPPPLLLGYLSFKQDEIDRAFNLEIAHMSRIAGTQMRPLIRKVSFCCSKES